MKSDIWKKVNYLLGLISVLVLFCLIILHANSEVKDLDLWLHLKTGEYIVQNRVVPVKDIFSFSLANKPWVNHEWLFQVIAFLFYNKWGNEGLISMQVFVVVVTFMILFLLGNNLDYKQRNYFKIVFGLMLVLLVYRTRFTIRPDIFSLLFFSIYLYMLTRFIDKKAIVYILPLIQIIWVNSHGFFSLGIVILLLYLSAEFIKRQFRLPWDWNDNRLPDNDYKRLKILFLLVFAASFANPCTFRGVMYPFNVLGQLAGESRIFFKNIQELRPPLHLRSIFAMDSFIYYKLLILFSFLCFFFNRRKLNINLFFLWLLFLALSVVAIRNIVFFSFIAYAVMMISLAQIKFDSVLPINFREERFKQITIASLGTLLIIWMIKLGNSISSSGYYVFENYDMKSNFSGISQRAYPQKAVDFILENNISGNIFNDFNSGAYLIGKCYPELHVFIDGRTELYGPTFFNSYKKILEEEPQLIDQISQKNNVNIVLLSCVFHPLQKKIISHLYRSPQWKLVFFDEFAVIFLKNIPENKQLIEKFRIDLNKWGPPKVDLLKLGPKHVYPYINISRANTLDSLELNKQVLMEVEEALKIMPECGEAYNLMGQVYARENSWQKAFENFRLAAAYLPSDPEIRTQLGIAYSKLHDIDRAMKQFNLAIKASPNYTNPYYHLALIQIDKKQCKEASELLRKAVKIDPKQVRYQELLADCLFNENKFADACEVYRKALEINEKSVEIHNKLAKSYLAIGLTKEAERQYKKAMEIDPENKEAKKQLMDLKRQDSQAR